MGTILSIESSKEAARLIGTRSDLGFATGKEKGVGIEHLAVFKTDRGIEVLSSEGRIFPQPKFLKREFRMREEGLTPEDDTVQRIGLYNSDGDGYKVYVHLVAREPPRGEYGVIPID